MKPELVQFVSANKNVVRLQEVNIENPGRHAVLMQFRHGGPPYVALLDRNGKVLATLPGYCDMQCVQMTFQPYLDH